MRAERSTTALLRIVAGLTRCAALASVCVTSAIHAELPTPERAEWNKVPIEVSLAVGVERQVQFPVPVKVGVPAGLATRLRVQSVSDTVYFQASAAFEPTRVVVQSRDGILTYLLDLTATVSEATTPPIQIVDPAIKAKPETVAGAVECAPRSTIDPVALTRYAAQQLYAPARLLQGLSGVVRVPVSAKPIDLTRGVTLTTVPVIAWRGGRFHVTAVKLTNTGHAPVELDPRSLKGDWLTATFQHNRLLAAGDEADTTVVYLVSARPIAAAR